MPYPPEALHLLRSGWPCHRPLPCSTKRAGSSASGAALVSHTSVVSSPSKYIQLKGTVSWSLVTLSLQVLVDSCSDDNFIEYDFVSQWNLPSEPLLEPKDMFALDGRLLARVTHQTAPVSLLLSGNHHETISLYIISSSSSPLVLGLPWFKRHNPHIDWSTSSITNWSLFCHSHCLHSAIPTPVTNITVPPKPIDLTSVPSNCHDLQEVFNKDCTFHLTHHMTVPLTCSQAPPYLRANCITSPGPKRRPWRLPRCWTHTFLFLTGRGRICFRGEKR